jgi:hypothetical protein
MITKKIYVEKVVPIIQKNAKSVLAGHKIPPAIITMIQTRPDVCAKIAVFGFNTINWKKGDKALKKNEQFKISGYKNYMDFSKNSISDIAKFQETLPLKDKKTFQANENVVTLLIVPDVATSDINSDIVTLKSTILTYGKSLDRTYSGLGGIFITIAFGESYILPNNVKRAIVKEKLNKKINVRKTPAKVKQELAQKNKEKLAKLKAEGAGYKDEKTRLSAQLQELQGLNTEFGGGAKEFDRGVKAEIKTNLAELTPKERKMYMDIEKYRADGKDSIADAIEADFIANSNRDILVNTPKNSTEILGERKANYEGNISKLEASNLELTDKITNAPNAKVKSALNYTLRQNLAKIEATKAKLNALGYSNKLSSTIEKKRAMLARINEKMELNFIAGMTIKDAMNNAVATSNIDKETIAEISADLKEEVANGMTQEEAIIEVITGAVEETVSTSDTRIDVNDGVAFVGRKVFAVNTVIEEDSVYEYTTEFFTTAQPNVEYFVVEMNADAYVDDMNATLETANTSIPTNTITLNDGEATEGDSVYIVEQDYVSGNYEVDAVILNIDTIDVDAQYFIDETKALEYASEMTELYLGDEASNQSSDEEKENEFNYVMLSRLVSDCDYFLGNGGRSVKNLWANSVEEQITEMKRLWNILTVKPEWLTMENILEYENKMLDVEATMYPINDGYIEEGSAVYGVDTDLIEGDIYEVFTTIFNPNSPNTTTEYFNDEVKAETFASDMNATIVVDEETPQQNSFDDINDILSFL